MLQIPDRNTKELLDLADFFETLEPWRYTQVQFRSGDARCICGWCNDRHGRMPDDQQGARKILGLPVEIASRLFRGAAGMKTDMISRMTGKTAPGPKDAARTLRHLAVTGELPADW